MTNYESLYVKKKFKRESKAQTHTQRTHTSHGNTHTHTHRINITQYRDRVQSMWRISYINIKLINKTSEKYTATHTHTHTRINITR